jgi:excisionase family DNA binding protein
MSAAIQTGEDRKLYGPNHRPKAAAALIGLSEGMVWKLLREGKLGSVKVGNARLIPQSEIDRLLSEAFTPARQS